MHSLMTGVLFSTKKHPRTADLSVGLLEFLVCVDSKCLLCQGSINFGFLFLTSNSFVPFLFWGCVFAGTYFILQPEDYWFSAPKKGVMVFALPGEPGLAEVSGDFKVHFHDRQGDFYLLVFKSDSP